MVLPCVQWLLLLYFHAVVFRFHVTGPVTKHCNANAAGWDRDHDVDYFILGDG